MYVHYSFCCSIKAQPQEIFTKRAEGSRRVKMLWNRLVDKQHVGWEQGGWRSVHSAASRPLVSFKTGAR